MEDIYNNLWLTMSYEEIIQYCSSSKFFRQICNQNTTWIFLLKRDFYIEDYYNKKYAKQMYQTYHHILKYFSKHFDVITVKAIQYIAFSWPESDWDNIIKNQKKHIKYGDFKHNILTAIMINIYAFDEDLEIDSKYIPKTYDIYDQDDKYVNQIINSDNPIMEYLNLVTNNTPILINKNVVLAKYDIDLAQELFFGLDNYMDYPDYMDNIEEHHKNIEKYVNELI